MVHFCPHVYLMLKKNQKINNICGESEGRRNNLEFTALKWFISDPHETLFLIKSTLEIFFSISNSTGSFAFNFKDEDHN